MVTSRVMASRCLETGVALCVVGLVAQIASGQDRSQGRSMVISQNGIVAAESPLAAQAGVRILESGGEAAGSARGTHAIVGGGEASKKGLGGGGGLPCFGLVAGGTSSFS